MTVTAQIGKTLSRLGLEERARMLYYRLHPSGVRKEVSVRGYRACFRCPTPVMADEVVTLGREREVLESFLDVLQPGWTVWDVGANLGLYTVFAAHRVGPTGKVVAFEPVRDTARRLNEHLDMNGIGNAEVLCCALGDQDGTAQIDTDAQGVSTVSSLARLDDAHAQPASGETIHLRSAQSLLRERPDLAPQSVKIDVEGAEVLVLEGFGDTAWRTIRWLLAEEHPQLIPLYQRRPEDFSRWLAERGFLPRRESCRRAERHGLFERVA